jgi:hypothetical protein
LSKAADDFLAWSRETGRYSDRVEQRLRSQVLRATEGRLMQRCLSAAKARSIDLDMLIAEVARGAASPDEAAERLIQSFAGSKPVSL